MDAYTPERHRVSRAVLTRWMDRVAGNKWSMVDGCARTAVYSCNGEARLVRCRMIWDTGTWQITVYRPNPVQPVLFSEFVDKDGSIVHHEPPFGNYR